MNQRLCQNCSFITGTTSIRPFIKFTSNSCSKLIFESNVKSTNIINVNSSSDPATSDSSPSSSRPPMSDSPASSNPLMPIYQTLPCHRERHREQWLESKTKSPFDICKVTYKHKSKFKPTFKNSMQRWGKIQERVSKSRISELQCTYPAC